MKVKTLLKTWETRGEKQIIIESKDGILYNARGEMSLIDKSILGRKVKSWHSQNALEYGVRVYIINVYIK